jgi:hypothetical protein
MLGEDGSAGTPRPTIAAKFMFGKAGRTSERGADGKLKLSISNAILATAAQRRLHEEHAVERRAIQ